MRRRKRNYRNNGAPLFAEDFDMDNHLYEQLKNNYRRWVHYEKRGDIRGAKQLERHIMAQLHTMMEKEHPGIFASVPQEYRPFYEKLYQMFGAKTYDEYDMEEEEYDEFEENPRQYNPWAICRSMQKKYGWSEAKFER